MGEYINFNPHILFEMRILIDTNILIKREENIVVSSGLQELLEVSSHLNNKIIVHPLSIKEIEGDKDDIRKEINLSKIGTYPKLESPPLLDDDKKFYGMLGVKGSNNQNDKVDNNLLYCVYKNSVHFLITEDKKMIKKAKKLGISDRVLNVKDAFDYFNSKKLPHKVKLNIPPAIKETPLYDINLKDPFFDPLIKSYSEFKDWWKEKSKDGRKAWVYSTDIGIGAILIYKDENESIHGTPSLSKKKRVKICTLKATHTGYKIGELFIKITIKYAIERNVDEIYLTHFSEENDHLIPLIQEFGFEKASINERGEDIFVKKLIPDDICKTPLELQKRFFPSFYDGKDVKKFIVPIKPGFHENLFTDYDKRQPTLYEFMNELIVEGNTIKKAYLCHSNIKKISAGDLIIFYRSKDSQKLTSIGVVEKVFYDLVDPDVIQEIVGKRTVYKRKEIEYMAKKPTKVILFYSNFHLPTKLEYTTLLKNKILKGYPQSIFEINHDKYLEIKKLSGLNTKYTIDKLEI
jgi:rRNA-processing protein FCF1